MTFFVDNNFEFSSYKIEAVEIFLQKLDTRIKRPAEIRGRVTHATIMIVMLRSKISE